MNTNEELKQLKIHEINENTISMLETVTVKDNIQDLFIDYIDDNGNRCILYSDTAGWQDGRRQVTYMNCQTGRVEKLYFTVVNGFEQPHEYTLNNPELMNVLWSIPNPVLKWAIKRSR